MDLAVNLVSIDSDHGDVHEYKEKNNDLKVDGGSTEICHEDVRHIILALNPHDIDAPKSDDEDENEGEDTATERGVHRSGRSLSSNSSLSMTCLSDHVSMVEAGT